MRLLLILLFGGAFSFSYGQQNVWNTFYEQLSAPNLDIGDLEKLFAIHALGNENKVLEAQQIFKRALHGNYSQQVYSLQVKKGDSPQQHYYLNSYSQNNQIIWMGLKAEGANESEVLLQHKAFDGLIQQLGEYLERSLDPSHQYFNPCDFLFVGFTCRTYDTLTTKLRQLVRKKDKKEILKWCVSLSPEIRLYGALGLYNLKKMGVLLNRQDWRLIKKIKQDRTLIYRCHSCYEDGTGGFIASMWSTFLLEKNALFYFPLRA